MSSSFSPYPCQQSQGMWVSRRILLLEPSSKKATAPYITQHQCRHRGAIKLPPRHQQQAVHLKRRHSARLCGREGRVIMHASSFRLIFTPPVYTRRHAYKHTKHRQPPPRRLQYLCSEFAPCLQAELGQTSCYERSWPIPSECADGTAAGVQYLKICDKQAAAAAAAAAA